VLEQELGIERIGEFLLGEFAPEKSLSDSHYGCLVQRYRPTRGPSSTFSHLPSRSCQKPGPPAARVLETLQLTSQFLIHRELAS